MRRGATDLSSAGYRLHARQYHPIVHQFDEKPPAAWLFALVGRRWVRVLLIGVVLLVVAGSVYYKTAVVPTLTATRFEVSVEGRANRVVIQVDDEAGVVAVSGGQNGVSQLVISDGSLMVLASEVGVNGGDARWVDVPLSMIDARWGALTPSRVRQALSRDVKECRRPSSDAVIIVGLLLGVSDTGVSLCGRGSGHADSTQWIVDDKAIRPSEVTDVPTSSVLALSATTAPEAVVTALDRLITEPGL